MSFLHEILVYPFWRAMEEDVLLLASLQDLQTRYSLARWNFYIDG